jgi:hypothetical protein
VPVAEITDALAEPGYVPLYLELSSERSRSNSTA